MKTKLFKVPIFNTIMYFITFLVNILAVLAIGYLIDNIILLEQYDNLFNWILIVLPLNIFAIFLNYCFLEKAVINICLNNTKILSSDLINKFFKLNGNEYEKNPKSYYLNVITTSVGIYSDVYSQKYVQSFGLIGTILTILLVSFYFNIILGLMFVIYIFQL